ncbi:MAG: hypothetical protein ACRDOD_24555, partial [Streptosporangiaceae bacterium]
FAREDAVEAAWAVVEPVLQNHRPASIYKPGSWGPQEASSLIAPDRRWHDSQLPRSQSSSAAL